MYTLYETINRPPPEHQSALLELSVGCSYGRCTFCQLSNGKTPLQLVPIQVLSENLMEMASQGESSTRMFMTGENVLAFKTRYLLDVFKYVRSYLPGIQEFAMYGRADDILHKTDEQLQALHSAGLNTIYVGVESGNRQVLKDCRKGEVPEEIVQQLHRLDNIGIQYGLSSILGLGGVKLWKQHALDTAELYNQVRPRSIRVMTLTPMEGTPLEDAVKKGLFHIPPPEIILQEELLLLETLNYADHRCRFIGNHVSNKQPIVGNVPDDQPWMIQALREALTHIRKDDYIHFNTW